MSKANPAVIGGFVQSDQRELIAPYAEKYFAAVKGVWESRSHEIAHEVKVVFEFLGLGPVGARATSD